MKNIPCMAAVLCIILAASAQAGEEYCEWTAENFSINEPLCGLTGDAASGRKLSFDRKKGNCLACHAMPIPEESFHGNIGPNLAGVGSRYSAGQLRLRLVDMKEINPMTLMPGFYKNPRDLNRVMAKFQGKTPLSAQEVEDVVVYLGTLQ